VAVVPTVVQKTQIRINIRKKAVQSAVQPIQSTLNTSTHINKTPTHNKTPTYTHPHITQQVKTNTVHDTPK
jgi:hypothetical protein